MRQSTIDIRLPSRINFEPSFNQTSESELCLRSQQHLQESEKARGGTNVGQDFGHVHLESLIDRPEPKKVQENG